MLKPTQAIVNRTCVCPDGAPGFHIRTGPLDLVWCSKVRKERKRYRAGQQETSLPVPASMSMSMSDQYCLASIAAYPNTQGMPIQSFYTNQTIAAIPPGSYLIVTWSNLAQLPLHSTWKVVALVAPNGVLASLIDLKPPATWNTIEAPPTRNPCEYGAFAILSPSASTAPPPPSPTPFPPVAPPSPIPVVPPVSPPAPFIPPPVTTPIATASVGGPNGSEFKATHVCPTGTRVVSFQGTSGNFLNQITATCSDGTILGPFGQDPGSHSYLLNQCARSGIQSLATTFGDSKSSAQFVYSIQPVCSDGTRDVTSSPSAQTGASQILTCPSGTVAVGIDGRSGFWIDKLSLLCGPAANTL